MKLLIAFGAGTLAGLSLWLALRGRRTEPMLLPVQQRPKVWLADDEPGGGWQW